MLFRRSTIFLVALSLGIVVSAAPMPTPAFIDDVKSCFSGCFGSNQNQDDIAVEQQRSAHIDDILGGQTFMNYYSPTPLILPTTSSDHQRGRSSQSSFPALESPDDVI